MAAGQFAPDEPGQPKAPGGEVKHADDPIKIVVPQVDKKAGRVTLPAAFWNQKMTSWVEVAVCGRPSDFLHETVVSITTTKALMMQAMRAAGFHDADAWVSNVRDFPRIRGDRFIILLQVTRNGKQETYALDELLSYEGWGVSAGPYGWMFKGDPDRPVKDDVPIWPPPAAPAAVPPVPGANNAADPEVADQTKILRDDPQIALVFKGIQHLSRSFADHPIAYDDWIYPMMRYGRNYQLLPAEVYDSNGDVPVTMIVQKVNEEQLIEEMAKVWHDKACAAYMLKELPAAREIDKEKAELWALLPKLRQMKATAPELRDAAAEEETRGKASLLAAEIEKGYATLDAAWAGWAADHPVFQAGDTAELDELKAQTKLWREHMDLRQKRAEQLAVAEKAAYDLRALAHQPQTDAARAAGQTLRGVEMEARSSALLAEDVHTRTYWKHEQGRIDKTDPRTDWIKQINLNVELYDTREAVGTAGLTYGRALQSSGPTDVAAAQKIYLQAVVRMTVAQLKVRQADVDFEISKREGFADDPDLPRLRAQKKALEEQLKQAEAATAATQPATQQ